MGATGYSHAESGGSLVATGDSYPLVRYRPVSSGSHVPAGPVRVELCGIARTRCPGTGGCRRGVTYPLSRYESSRAGQLAPAVPVCRVQQRARTCCSGTGRCRRRTTGGVSTVVGSEQSNSQNASRSVGQQERRPVGASASSEPVRRASEPVQRAREPVQRAREPVQRAREPSQSSGTGTRTRI